MRAMLTTDENTARWYTVARKRGNAATSKPYEHTVQYWQKADLKNRDACAEQAGWGWVMRRLKQPLDTQH